ncbi:MAG TPA: CHAT domain-containing protein [Pyrinomonadaceae bacterium]|nr:CHAT domain-containing protein [Pyrinomonadaceae bacterium]
MRTVSRLAVIVILALLAAAGIRAQNLVSPLSINVAVDAQIKGGETQSYSVEIPQGQTARVEVEQKGVDIALAAYTPTGERFIETESPSGLVGNDFILVTATTTGTYKIDVIPSDPRAAVGKYSIKLADIRPTAEADHQINAAAKRITKVADEATILRQNGTREGRRAAIVKFDEVIQLSRQKQDKVWELISLITIGLLYEQLGEVQRSIDFYTRGLEMARVVGNKQYEGSSINNLAVAYLTLAEYETSVSYLSQAMELQTAAGNRRGQGVVYNNLGTAHLMLGNIQRSEENYKLALDVRREVKDERGEGFALNNLGQVYLESGDFTKAKDYFEQAISLRKRIADKQGEAVTERNLGKLLVKTGEADAALPHLIRANELSGQLGDRRVQADTLYWLATVEARKGNVDKAIIHIGSGLGIIEQIRGEIVNPQLRTGYFSTVPQFYELYASLLVQRGQATKSQADIDLSFQVSERARARTLVEILQEARIDIEKGPDAKALDELQESLNAKYRDKTTLLAGKYTPEQLAKLTNEINKLTQDVEALQVKIRRENPRYADITLGSVRSTSEIRELLDDNTVLIEYKLGDERSFVWTVTKDKVNVSVLPSRDKIESIARAYYTSVSSPNKTAQATSLKHQTEINNILLGPISSLIGTKRLAIVGDGVLQFLPFAALQRVASNEVIVLPSAGVLAELRENSKPRETKANSAIVIADPVFEPNDSRLASRSTATEKPSALARVMRDVVAGQELPRLLSSRQEARDIQALLTEDRSTVKLDFEASLDGVTGTDLTKFRYVHFATHGLVNTRDPRLSGLVFSLFDKSGKPKEGLMRLEDIYDLKLDADLVVLSACQTALGKDVRGEGLIGLTRGIMYAGSRQVLATLWKVDDAATAEFMKRFYGAMVKDGLPSAAALKRAQSEMKAIPRYRTPFFWAGFTLQGDWKQ